MMLPRRKEWVRTRCTGLLCGVEVLRCFSGGRSPEERRRLSESRRLEGFPSSAGRNSGSGLTTRFVREGMTVGLAARNPDKLGSLCDATGARAFACDATDPEQVEWLFSAVDSAIGVPDVVVYNAAARVGGPFVDLQPSQVQQALASGAFGAFL